VWEEINKLVSEDGHAARFESHHRDAGFNLGLESIENFEQQRFRAVEHPEIVERASTAEVGLRDAYLESCGLEDLNSSFRRAREEVVVEGVGPEEDGWG
jgi:hypothetical protein